jgi:hypothetical protein
MDSQDLHNNTISKNSIQPQKDVIQAVLQQLRSGSEVQLLVALPTLAYDIFIPWTSEQVLANKRFFAECGGISLLMSHLKSNNFWVQRMVAIACWNFAENLETTRLMYDAGAVPEILRFLHSSDPHTQSVGAGWLWGFLEYEETLEFMNKENVPKTLISLINVCDALELYRIIGCVQSLTLNDNCRQQLVENGIIPIVASLASFPDLSHENLQNITSCKKLLIHHSVHVLAHLATDERYTHQVIEAGGLKKIREWCQTVTPQEMAALEKTHRYLWHNFKLFYKLCESKYEEIVALGVWSLCYLSASNVQREEMLTQNIPDKMVYFTWHPDAKIKEWASQFLNNFKPLLFSPPSLRTLCYYELLKKQKNREDLRTFLRESYGIQLSDPPL